MSWYKIFDERADAPHTLFHGIDRTKKMPLNKWIIATVKHVTDGSGTTVYRSGFHIMGSIEDCAAYLKRFKNLEHKVIVEVEATNLWPKWHSPSPVWLAEQIMIKPEAWENRVRWMDVMEEYAA